MSLPLPAAPVAIISDSDEGMRILMVQRHQNLANAGGAWAFPGGRVEEQDYADTSEIMAEINALTPSYGGITHERLENGERLQWPCPSLDHPGTPILHVSRAGDGAGGGRPRSHLV